MNINIPTAQDIANRIDTLEHVKTRQRIEFYKFMFSEGFQIASRGDYEKELLDVDAYWAQIGAHINEKYRGRTNECIDGLTMDQYISLCNDVNRQWFFKVPNSISKYREFNKRITDMLNDDSLTDEQKSAALDEIFLEVKSKYGNVEDDVQTAYIPNMLNSQSLPCIDELATQKIGTD